jgi:hypothetical protein
MTESIKKNIMKAAHETIFVVGLSHLLLAFLRIVLVPGESYNYAEADRFYVIACGPVFGLMLFYNLAKEWKWTRN